VFERTGFFNGQFSFDFTRASESFSKFLEKVTKKKNCTAKKILIQREPCRDFGFYLFINTQFAWRETSKEDQ